jgi:hypothetical protein
MGRKKKSLEERAVVKSLTVDRATLHRLAAHKIKNFSDYACQALNEKMDHDEKFERLMRKSK